MKSIRNTLAVTVAAIAVVGSGTVAATTTASAATASPVTRVVQANISLNVRSGPGTTYSSVGNLAGGTTVTGTVTGSWLKITSGSFTGRYVSTSYLTAPPAAQVQPGPGQKVGWVMADPSAYGSLVNIRSAAATTSAVVGHFGAHARVVGTPIGDGTWWKVSGGYLNSGVLETSTPDPSTINAKIPLNTLCVIPSVYYSQLPAGVIGYGYSTATKRYLQCKALPHLVDLENAYKASFGAYAGVDNAYRTWAEQAYWYTKLKGHDVSLPGQSNHGYGLAVDFQANYTNHPFTTFEKGGKGRAWMVANGPRFGFSDIGDGDPVHFNFVG